MTMNNIKDFFVNKKFKILLYLAVILFVCFYYYKKYYKPEEVLLKEVILYGQDVFKKEDLKEEHLVKKEETPYESPFERKEKRDFKKTSDELMDEKYKRALEAKNRKEAELAIKKAQEKKGDGDTELIINKQQMEEAKKQITKQLEEYVIIHKTVDDIYNNRKSKNQIRVNKNKPIKVNDVVYVEKVISLNDPEMNKKYEEILKNSKYPQIINQSNIISKYSRSAVKVGLTTDYYKKLVGKNIGDTFTATDIDMMNNFQKHDLEIIKQDFFNQLEAYKMEYPNNDISEAEKFFDKQSYTVKITVLDIIPENLVKKHNLRDALPNMDDLIEAKLKEMEKEYGSREKVLEHMNKIYAQ